MGKEKVLVNMQEIESVVASFNNWSQPWAFYKYVNGNSSLTIEQKLFFEDLYKKAGDVKFWNFNDLKIGYANCKSYLKENYAWSDVAIDNIARALSYEWK